jgi:hypothetical protein
MVVDYNFVHMGLEIWQYTKFNFIAFSQTYFRF